MALRITTLSENTAGSIDILGEWGLSILVETDEAQVLLDTGRNISTSHNADSLGIDLSVIDKIALSHGHVDHTGGLREVLRRMKKEIEIIAHPDIWAPKYRHREEQADRFIGIPFQRRELKSLGAVFNLTKKPVRITDAVTTTDKDYRAQLLNMYRYAQWTDNVGNRVAGLQRCQLTSGRSYLQENDCYTTLFFVPVGNRHRDAFAGFIDPEHNKVPRLGLPGYSRRLNLEQMNIGHQVLF